MLSILADATYGAEKIVEGSLSSDPVAARRALRFGLQIGLDIVELIYNGKYTASEVYFAFEELIKSNRGQVLETNNENATEKEKMDNRILEQIVILQSLGEKGLDELNDSSRSTIEKWSLEAVAEPELRKLYALGCGATLIATSSLHESLIEHYAVKQVEAINWNHIPRPDTSE